MIRIAGLATAVATAFAASLCCIGPILAATLGLTSLGGLVRFESLRPLFGGFSVASLGLAFVSAYRSRNSPECEPGSVCDVHGRDRVNRLNRIVLWVATVITIIVLTLPTWSNWILG